MATTSIVDPSSQLHETVSCGEFALVGVQPGADGAPLAGTRIGAHGNIRSHSVIYAGSVIGNRFQTGHGAMIRENNRIGDDVSIGSHSIIEHDVCIGNGVRIHSNSFVPEFTVIEDNVWIGPGVVLTNAKYPNTPGAKTALAGPHLCKGCVIGAGAVILPGVRIGRGAMIGAGAVVTDDVADDTAVVGNPAKENTAATERVLQARL